MAFGTGLIMEDNIPQDKQGIQHLILLDPFSTQEMLGTKANRVAVKDDDSLNSTLLALPTETPHQRSSSFSTVPPRLVSA